MWRGWGEGRGWEFSGRVQRGFREGSGRAECVFHVVSVRFQGGFRENSERIQRVSGRAVCVFHVVSLLSLTSLCLLPALPVLPVVSVLSLLSLPPSSRLFYLF